MNLLKILQKFHRNCRYTNLSSRPVIVWGTEEIVGNNLQNIVTYIQNKAFKTV